MLYEKIRHPVCVLCPLARCEDQSSQAAARVGTKTRVEPHCRVGLVSLRNAHHTFPLESGARVAVDLPGDLCNSLYFSSCPGSQEAQSKI